MDALLAVKRGDPAAAEKAIAAVGTDASFSASVRRDLLALKSETARLRRGR